MSDVDYVSGDRKDILRSLEELREASESIERKIRDLEGSVKEGNVEMKGRLGSAVFDEEDFEKAEKSLFGEA